VTDIKVLLFDVGGVLLTNGWDRPSRRRACDRFELDWEEFGDRHDLVAAEFETGGLTMAEYLQRTVFYRDRAFGRKDFVDFMESMSAPLAGSLELLGSLVATGRYLLATLNNESRELNEYRIETFGLRDHFSLFLSSCYLGVSKPEKEIYKMAIDLTQHRPEDCVFVDDRPLNLECAESEGIHPIHFQSPAELHTSLNVLGVTV
jgi:putative hydrolase of the HAD superfamily